MKTPPPLVVLVLGGTAGRRDAPPERSPLHVARTPALDRLAENGRVFGVQLVDGEAAAHTAAPLLALLGLDPAGLETARGAYLGAHAGETLAAEECFVSADFLTLFRDHVADVEPGPFRPAEAEELRKSAAAAVGRAGFRLRPGFAIAPRASVDPAAPPPIALLNQAVGKFAPAVEQHAFAHRLMREALEEHEVNEVRRDLGANGADMVWLWGPGGAPRLPALREPLGALGTDPLWKAVATAAGVSWHAPNAKAPAQFVRGVSAALKKVPLVVLYVRRGVADALQRDLRVRADGLEDMDAQLVAPLAEVVRKARARLLVLSDTARDTATGAPTGDPVPVLLWGAGVEGLRRLPFTEAGAAAGGEPLAPGYGLLPYVRNL